jgi:hypothetical protein
VLLVHGLTGCADVFRELEMKCYLRESRVPFQSHKRRTQLARFVRKTGKKDVPVIKIGIDRRKAS